MCGNELSMSHVFCLSHLFSIVLLPANLKLAGAFACRRCALKRRKAHDSERQDKQLSAGDGAMFVAWTTGDARIVDSDAEAANLLNHTFHASTVHSCAVILAHLPANSSRDVAAFSWLASCPP